jgi:betaine-homocysteine S-methyltransferase
VKDITNLIKQDVVVGDGGYLIELERRGYVDSGSGRERVGTGRGSGQFTPEVAIEHPEALRELHREFLAAGAQALQALTFFGTREKLGRAGYGEQTEAINRAAVKIAKEVAAGKALVAGSVSRTQLIEREGPQALGRARDLIAEQIRLLHDAGVDFLILETFFRLDEMLAALEVATEIGLPVIATLSFRPLTSRCSDDRTPAECARALTEHGAIAVGANCEQEPRRMLPLLRQMRAATHLPLAAQPAAFRTTDDCECFTRQPAFPDALETIQIPRDEFFEFGQQARAEGIGYIGGCCGCNAAYLRALVQGLKAAAATPGPNESGTT